MKKLLLIYNPVSGDGRIVPALSSIVDLMTKEEYLVTVYPTQKPLDAQEQIEEIAHDFDRIVVCGGDGMLHEAINGWLSSPKMKNKAPILGYIPTGTVNDFASTHQISKDPIEATKIAGGGHWESVDIGQFNDQYFSYVAAFGIATAVSYQTPQRLKQKLGPLAYVLEALNSVDFSHWENNCETMKISWQDHEIEGYQTPQRLKQKLGPLAYVLEALNSVDFSHWENNCETMKISWQDHEIEGDFLYGMVSNSQYVAGQDFFKSSLFDWQDGLLEGLFIRRPMNIIDLNTIIGGLTRGDFSHPLFVLAQSPWFDFETHQSKWTLDGEYGGNIIDLNTIIGGLTRGDFSHPLFVLAQSPWFDFETHQSKWTLDGEYGGTQ